VETQGEIISAGLDYISLTMLNNNPACVEWQNIALTYLQSLTSTLGEMQLSKRLGYEGLSIGGSFVGTRERDTIAVFSGERAKPAYPLLYRSDTNVSRVDVQVSYRYRTTNPSVAQVARNQVERDNRTIGAARQRNATLIEDLKGGATCYVGTRTSEQFGRIYNKAAESGEAQYDRVWRFEVQLKNKLARKLCEQLATNTYKPEAHAVMFVKQWLRHRGVQTPWKAEAELLPLPKLSKDPTENEQKLAWLRSQVRPAIRSLLKYGLRDAILEALGLEEAPTR
jgi:Replication initiation factor